MSKGWPSRLVPSGPRKAALARDQGWGCAKASGTVRRQVLPAAPAAGLAGHACSPSCPPERGSAVSRDNYDLPYRVLQEKRPSLFFQPKRMMFYRCSLRAKGHNAAVLARMCLTLQKNAQNMCRNWTEGPKSGFQLPRTLEFQPNGFALVARPLTHFQRAFVAGPDK